MSHGRFRIVAALAGLYLAFPPAALHAQGTWDAMLSIQPFPSPYYSDWDLNPNIASLTILNHTGSAEDVRIFFTIADRMNRVIVSGRSEPERIEAGAIALYDSPYEIAGSTSHDEEVERVASRTGRLPEGDYTACATAADPSGFVLAESCADFFIAYPDPPLLLGPEDGAALAEEDPLFQWTPVQVPPEYQLAYGLRVVEVLEGQLPGEALASNIPVHEQRDGFGTSLRYPLDARPLEPGKTYAWSVQALDQNGYAAAANHGRSEIWTFEMEDPATTTPASGVVELTLTNTWESVGDIVPDDALLPLEAICELPPPAASTTGAEPLDSTGAKLKLGLSVSIPPIPGIGTTATRPGNLYRQMEGSTTGAWTLLVPHEKRTFLLYGECGATGPALGLGGLRWVAVRNTGTLGDLVNVDESYSERTYSESQRANTLPPTPAGELPLRFGVVILALAPTTTALPPGFPLAEEFLNYQEIDLRMGVNLYAMVDVLRDTEDLPIGTFLNWVGYYDKYIAFQGFAGIDTEWSVGGYMGRPTGEDFHVMGELSRVRTLLTLQASLPPRHPRVLQYFETAQAGLRFDVMDSTGIQQGTGARTQTNRDLIFTGTVDLTARADAAFAPGSHWYGSLGWQLTRIAVDTASAKVRALAPGAESDTKEWAGKWVLKLGVDELQLGAGQGLFSNVYLSGLQLEIDVLNLREAILEKDRGTLSIDALGTAAIGVGEFDDLGQLTLGLGRKGNEVLAAATPAVEGPRNRPPGPLTREQTEREAEAQAERRQEHRAAGGVYDPVDPEAEDQAPRTSSPQLENPTTKPGSLHWGARVSIGNMSLGEFLQLLKQGFGDAPPPPGGRHGIPTQTPPEDGSDG